MQVPGSDTSETHLSSSEIEIGMGIHNESGMRRVTLGSLNTLITQLLDLLTSTSDLERSFLPFRGEGQDRVVLMVNNLGSVSELELAGIVRAAKNDLEARGFVIDRLLAGTFMVGSHRH